MQLLFTCGMWGMVPADLPGAFTRMRTAGFDAVNLRVPATHEAAREAVELAAAHGLKIVLAYQTSGSSPDLHIASFQEMIERAASMRPLLLNAHSGSDFFSHDDNVRIIAGMNRIARDHGLRLAHETHRGRATFCIPATMRLLDDIPELRLTADFSHWCVVHECLLDGQRDQVARAAARAINIHARVGHGEGPQVNDPRAPEWHHAVERHLSWWSDVVSANRAAGEPFLTVHPEFGPPDYMPTLPYTQQPVADLFAVNCYMKDLLRERLASS